MISNNATRAYNSTPNGSLARKRSRSVYNASIKGKLLDRAVRLKREYGLTLEQYSQMLVDQNHQCPICELEVKLVVDHNHDTGKVRGLLCGKCNKGLGIFADDTSRLTRAIVYLKEKDQNVI